MTVFLVGAGPGDPGLLTVRGAELLATADVVVYDRLSVASLLEQAPESTELISVGKRPGDHSMTQDRINELLVERGRLGQRVVRLKGGDPFVFARGGEEVLALREAGVDFEVVPGVTSALAAPAAAGIPVTMRHSSTLFTVITGHEDPDKGGELDWRAVAGLGGTIVILMGVGRIAKIVDHLIEGGLSPDTPAAAVQWGTRPEQRTIRTTLAALPHEPLASPSVIVVGKVAALDLGWFESRPLFGRTVVVTRARAQASDLSARLHAAGAEVVEVPVIEVAEPADGGAALRAAADELRAGSYAWVVVTSPNGASRLLSSLRDARDLAGTSVAAIGTSTAQRLEEGGIVADLVPDRFVAESLAEAFPPPPAPGGRVLLARAAVARDVLPRALAAAGWEVDDVEAYRTVAAPLTDDQRERAAAADIVTFTSSSTVDRYLDAIGDRPPPPFVACIGPVTAARAEARGLRVDAVAAEHTVAGLVEAIVSADLPPRMPR